MTKWEYVTLIMDNLDQFSVAKINDVRVDEKEVETTGLFGGKGSYKRKPFLQETLSGMGKQGWEVCGVVPTETGSSGACIILKRSLEE